MGTKEKKAQREIKLSKRIEREKARVEKKTARLEKEDGPDKEEVSEEESNKGDCDWKTRTKRKKVEEN